MSQLPHTHRVLLNLCSCTWIDFRTIIPFPKRVPRNPIMVEIPQTMKAWTFSRRGKPRNILELKSLPTPTELKPDEVLIQVSHAGLNPFGYLMLWAVPTLARHKPSIPEYDFSGRVVGLGADAQALFKIGEDVFGALKPLDCVKTGVGSLAEYVVASKDFVLHKPESMSLEAAGGAGITFLTAAALLRKARLSKGDHVFVNGGSGGTGLALIPWAKDIVGEQGKVVTTCSSQTLELVKSFGADEVGTVLDVRRTPRVLFID